MHTRLSDHHQKFIRDAPYGGEHSVTISGSLLKIELKSASERKSRLPAAACNHDSNTRQAFNLRDKN